VPTSLRICPASEPARMWVTLLGMSGMRCSIW
jgi:hypothetical protein